MRLALCFTAFALASCDRTASTIAPERASPSLTTPSSAAPPAPAPDRAPASAVNTRATAALDDVPEALRWPPGYVPPEIWETREVLLDGVKETWSLRWKRPPRFNGCPLEPSCACFGVEWGLAGALELVRERPGAPVERLDLGALREGGAQIPGFLASPLDREERDDHGNLVRPIAVTSARRFPAFPDVPTFTELGLKDMELEIYYLLHGPAGLPAEVTARLNKASAAALTHAQTRERFVTAGMEAWNGPNTPDAAKNVVATELKRFTTIGERTGIKITG